MTAAASSRVNKFNNARYTYNMTAGFESRESIGNDNDVKNNSHKNENSVVYSPRDTNKEHFINPNITYTEAIGIAASHLGVPEVRQGEFRDAVVALAQDARAPSPRLLPIVLSKAPSETPGTIVTDAAPFPALEFPKIAPERWIPRGKGHRYHEGDETPEDFAVRVYGEWMKSDNTGISMAEILHLDEPLYHALRRSTRIVKAEGFHLPTKSERISALIEHSAFRDEPDGYRFQRRLEATAATRKHRNSKM